MYSRVCTVINPSGLHARPASTFARLAMTFKSKILVGKAGSGHLVNAKSLVMVLTEAMGCGTQVELQAEGPDEKQAVDALVELIESGCGE